MKKPVLIVLLLVLIAAAAVTVTLLYHKPQSDKRPAPGFLMANGKNWIDSSGKTVLLRGVNVGNFFVQEFWMSPTEGSETVRCQKELEEVLTERFGEARKDELLNAYLDHFFTEEDFDYIRDLGLNCIRLPLWYGVFTDAEGNWKEDAFSRVDWFIKNAEQRDIYVILDMHGAYGSQNGSDHSGIDGGDDKKTASEFFFGDRAEQNQELFFRLWEKLAEHYRDWPAVAGYDLLNEPFCTYRYNSGLSDRELHQLLYDVYDTAYRRIRAVDPDHVILFEAVWDPSDLPNPKSRGWDNVVYEYHQYEYSHYQNENNAQVEAMEKKVRLIRKANYSVPSLMGEFNLFNSMDAWTESLALLNENGISWTLWSYKCLQENDNWGLKRLSVPIVYPETDSFEDILAKWSSVGEAEENRPLADAVRSSLK